MFSCLKKQQERTHGNTFWLKKDFRPESKVYERESTGERVHCTVNSYFSLSYWDRANKHDTRITWVWFCHDSLKSTQRVMRIGKHVYTCRILRSLVAEMFTANSRKPTSQMAKGFSEFIAWNVQCNCFQYQWYLPVADHQLFSIGDEMKYRETKANIIRYKCRRSVVVKFVNWNQIFATKPVMICFSLFCLTYVFSVHNWGNLWNSYDAEKSCQTIELKLFPCIREKHKFKDSHQASSSPSTLIGMQGTLCESILSLCSVCSYADECMTM